MATVTFTCPRCGTRNTDQRACDGPECTYALSVKQWRRLGRQAALQRFLPGSGAIKEGVPGRSGLWLFLALTALTLIPFVPGAPGAVPALTEESWQVVNTGCSSCEGSVVSATALQVRPTGIMSIGRVWTTADRVYLTIESPDPAGVRLAARAANETPQVGQVGRSGRVWFSRVDEPGHLGRFAGTFAFNDRVTISADGAAEIDQWSAGPLRGMPVHRIDSPLSGLPVLALVAGGALLGAMEFRRTTFVRFFDRIALTLALVAGTLTAGWLGPSISRTLGRAVSLTTYSTGVGLALLALYAVMMVGAPTLAFLLGRRIDERVPLRSKTRPRRPQRDRSPRHGRATPGRRRLAPRQLHPTVIRSISALLSVLLLVAAIQLLDQAIASTFIGFEF